MAYLSKYSGQDVDSILDSVGSKANMSNVYSIDLIDMKLNDFATTESMDEQIRNVLVDVNNKANASDVYTKEELNQTLNEFATQETVNQHLNNINDRIEETNVEIEKIQNQIDEELSQIVTNSRTYSIQYASDDELESIGGNIKTAYKLVDNRLVLNGEYIKIFNDASVEEDIIVAGGVLDSTALREVLPKDKDGNAYIAKNTSFQSLFQTLFTKISWPSPSFSEGSISASTSIVGGSANASGVVEVGTIVNIGSVTVNKSTSSITNRKWSGFTYGYATSVTGQINSSTYITGTNENNVTYSGNYTLSGKVSGFSGISYTQISNADNTKVKYDTKSGTIKEGTNSITFSLTGAKASVTLSSMPVYYIASNVKTLSKDHKTEAKNNKSVSSSNPTASKSVSVTGKYLYYLGYSSNTAFDQFNSDSIKKLTTRSGWTEIDGTTTIVNDNAIKSNGNSIVIACANKYKLSSIKNALGADIMESFSSVGTVDYVVNDTTTSYNVYVYPITNGAEVEFKNVSLVKA